MTRTGSSGTTIWRRCWLRGLPGVFVGVKDGEDSEGCGGEGCGESQAEWASHGGEEELRAHDEGWGEADDSPLEEWRDDVAFEKVDQQEEQDGEQAFGGADGYGKQDGWDDGEDGADVGDEGENCGDDAEGSGQGDSKDPEAEGDDGAYGGHG